MSDPEPTAPSFSLVMTSPQGFLSIHDRHPATRRDVQIGVDGLLPSPLPAFNFSARTPDTRIEGHVLYRCEYATQNRERSLELVPETVPEQLRSRESLPSVSVSSPNAFVSFYDKIKAVIRAFFAPDA